MAATINDVKGLEHMHGPFYLVAGADAYRAERASCEAHVIPSKNIPGTRDSGSLVYWQTHEGRAWQSVELVDSLYGWSVRASSGLDGFALLAGSRRGDLDGSWGQARAWAERWVAQDPAHRYALVRGPLPKQPAHLTEVTGSSRHYAGEWQVTAADGRIHRFPYGGQGWPSREAARATIARCADDNGWDFGTEAGGGS